MRHDARVRRCCRPTQRGMASNIRYVARIRHRRLTLLRGACCEGQRANAGEGAGPSVSQLVVLQ
jgi:hypothetical protein